MKQKVGLFILMKLNNFHTGLPVMILPDLIVSLFSGAIEYLLKVTDTVAVQKLN